MAQHPTLRRASCCALQMGGIHMNTLSFCAGPDRVTRQGVTERLVRMVRVAGEEEVKTVVGTDS